MLLVYSIRAAKPAAAIKPTGAAVYCAAAFPEDEADALAESVADSLLPSVELGSTVPVVVTLVTKVEPSVVIDDSVTPVVREPEAAVPEAESVAAEKTVLVPTSDVATLPSLLVKVDWMVVVVMGTDPPTTPVPPEVELSVTVEVRTLPALSVAVITTAPVPVPEELAVLPVP